MSGPKVSDYELDQRRQERLRRKYQEEQRRRQEEARRRREEERRRQEEQRRIEAHRRQQEEFRAGIRRNVDSLKKLKAEVTAAVDEISRNKNCRFNMKAYRRLCEEADALNKRSMASHGSSEISPQMYENCRKETERMMEQLIQQQQQALNEQRALESADFVSSLQSIRSISSTPNQKTAQMTRTRNRLLEKRTEDIYRGSSAALAGVLSEMPDKADQIRRLQKRLDSEVKELGGTAQEVLRAAEDCRNEITHQVTVWRKEAARMQEAEARRSELIHRYHYYCDELALSRMQVEELAAQSVTQLESLCATLDNMLYRQYEENYIFQCINEAMAELGYTLYGRGMNGIRGQFLYRMHGDTVVHVSCSEQGIISMEVGQAASGQRQLDADEVAGQVRDMETFCGDYAALQQALAEKGVSCRRNILLSPPDPMYAQVLDTSEYEIKQAVDTGETQTVYRYFDGKG